MLRICQTKKLKKERTIIYTHATFLQDNGILQKNRYEDGNINSTPPHEEMPAKRENIPHPSKAMTDFMYTYVNFRLKFVIQIELN